MVRFGGGVIVMLWGVFFACCHSQAPAAACLAAVQPQPVAADSSISYVLCNTLSLNTHVQCSEASRRGLGAVLLRKPQKLARLVSGIVQGSELPVTVKIRTGEKEEKITAGAIAALMEAAGAAAVTIHGRTTEQR